MFTILIREFLGDPKGIEIWPSFHDMWCNSSKRVNRFLWWTNKIHYS